jgi:putative chitinase
MKTYQEKISEVSNQFTKLLGSSTLLSDMMKMFQSLVDFTSTFVVPAFQFVGENSKIFGVALGGLAVVVGTVNGILAVNNFLEKMRQIANMGAVAGLGKLAVASLAAALPFIKFAAPVLLLIYAFNKLGGDLSVVSNAFKYVGSILTTVFKTAFKAILSIINKIPGFRGDFDNQIKELNDDLASEETKRSNITKEVTATMKKNREETEKSTEAKKEENKQIEQATSTTAQYDFSSPLKLFESSARRAGSAASTAATPPGGAAATRSLSGNMSSSLASAGITDPRAIANIMAQIQAESGGVAKSENLNYSGKKLFELYGAGNKGGNKVRFNTQAEAEAVASKGPEAVGNVIYGGRMGNAADEGFKYRGRGLIQLTGKNNYKKYGDMIGVDLVSNPDLANDPKVAEQLAVAYFAEKQKQGVNLSDINAIGKAVGYAGGSAETSKRAAMAEQFLAGGGASTPSSASVVASVQQPTPAAPAATTPSSTGAGAPGAGGIATLNDVVAGLNSLNMMMGQVVATNKRVVEVAEKQLSVQKNLSGDLYLAA